MVFGRPSSYFVGNKSNIIHVKRAVRVELKLQTQAELEYTRAAPAQARIALRNVGRLCAHTARTLQRERLARNNRSRNDNAARQREIGMIENVEKLDAQFGAHSLVDGRRFGDGKVEIAETRAINLVAAKIPKTWR